MGFASIEDAVPEIAAGRFVVVVDDADRENEGDLIMAAEKVTPEAISFMVRHTSGVICVPLLGERLNELALPPMVSANTDPLRTAFTVSVDVKAGTTTGISAADRARTIAALVDPAAGTRRPGHRPRPQGARVRAPGTRLRHRRGELAARHPR